MKGWGLTVAIFKGCHTQSFNATACSPASHYPKLSTSYRCFHRRMDLFINWLENKTPTVEDFPSFLSLFVTPPCEALIVRFLRSVSLNFNGVTADGRGVEPETAATEKC